MKADAIGILSFVPRDKTSDAFRRRSRLRRRLSSSRMYQDSDGNQYNKTTVAVKTLKGEYFPWILDKNWNLSITKSHQKSSEALLRSMFCAAFASCIVVAFALPRGIQCVLLQTFFLVVKMTQVFFRNIILPLRWTDTSLPPNSHSARTPII